MLVNKTNFVKTETAVPLQKLPVKTLPPFRVASDYAELPPEASVTHTHEAGVVVLQRVGRVERV